jgi:hypothetical protein
MKINYRYTFIPLFFTFLVSGNIRAQQDYDDDVYNAGKPLKHKKAQDSIPQDTTCLSEDPYRYGNRFYFSNGIYYRPYHYHFWFCNGFFHPGFYSGNNYCYGHKRPVNTWSGPRKEVSTNHARMGVPHSKPTSTRGGFGSTGMGHPSIGS